MLGLGLILLTLALGVEAAFWCDGPGGFCAVFLLWGTLLVALGRLVPRLAGLAEGLGVFVILTTLNSSRRFWTLPPELPRHRVGLSWRPAGSFGSWG